MWSQQICGVAQAGTEDRTSAKGQLQRTGVTLAQALSEATQTQATKPSGAGEIVFRTRHM